MSNLHIIVINAPSTQQKLSSQQKTDPAHNIASDNLANIIYTSGSTGKPKGVMVTHRGVVSLVKNVDYINICPSDTFIQFADIAFDAATFEIWGPLLNGAKLYIPHNPMHLLADTKALNKTLVENAISILWLTKSLFDQLFLSDQGIFKSIKYLLIGGEALNKKLLSKLVNSSYAPQNIINGYGPTENTTFSCTLNIKKNHTKDFASIPIGKPLTNRTAYVLDKDLAILPIGAIGQLYLGGAGIARGYLNNLELTAEQFIDNPFPTKTKIQDNRLYKSGDLARWLPDGNLEYIGRNDTQVKFKGYRIELREIENVLLDYPGVTQSVVTLREVVTEADFSHKYLVSYYTAQKPLDDNSILLYLQEKLPEYMVPSTLVYLEQVPLTKNGKFDYRALSSYEAGFNKHNYEPPKNWLEEQICKVWSEVLEIRLNKVGIKNDFFQQGGNSILSIKLLHKLNTFLKEHKKISESISLPSLMRARNIEGIIKLINIAHPINSGMDLFKKDIILEPEIKLPEIIGGDVSKKTAIFLTGGTGLLGAHLLHKLLQMNNIKIYCLVRAESSKEGYERLKASFSKYNLDHFFLVKERVEIVAGDFSKIKFAINPHDYHALAKKIDIIIHNGAAVNHIYPYELLRDENVKSTKCILQFAAIGKPKKISYISTLSIINSNLHPISRSNFKNINLDEGYVATKLASEILLEEAKKRGFKVNIFRPGLFFHEENGIYKFENNNHFYSFISSLIQFKKYPDINMAFDILPACFISNAIIQIIFYEAPQNSIFNFISPNKLSLQALINHLKLKKFTLEKISLKNWDNLIKNIDEESNLFKFSSLYSTKMKSQEEQALDNNVKNISNKASGQIDFKYPSVPLEAIAESIIYKFNNDKT